MEVVTSLCVCSIHPRIKALPVCVNVSEYLCVFVGNRADFRALGIKRQRSSSLLPVLHIYSIGGEEKKKKSPRRVPSAAAINSLETPLVSRRLQGTLMGV